MISIGKRILIRVISIVITAVICIVMFPVLLLGWIIETAVGHE
jgi:hypothetical protein